MNKNRLLDPSEICALDVKQEFDDPRFARFQGLSTSIGRFSAYATPDRRSASLQKNTVSIQLRHFLAILATCAFRGGS
jgi:hypothetical protein